MEYRHLRFFLAVAEELHFTRAAARLGIAQPHVSQEIRKLEKELGTELFARTRRRVELTPAGRVFQAGALEILALSERVVLDARRAARGEIGRLRIGFAGSAGYDVFPEAIRRFRERWPEVELHLVEMSTVAQLKSLLEGTIDVALGRPRAEPRPGVELEIVRQEPALVALSTAHPLAHAEGVALADFAEDGWIAFDRTGGPGLFTLLATACQEAGFELRVAQEVGEIPTMINLVAGGVGVALVPAPVGRLRREGVVFKRLEGVAPLVPLGLMWRQDGHEPAIGNFVEVVREVAGPS